MEINFNKDLFGKLWEFVQDEDVTDIKWNGSTLWIDNLKKGRYMVTDEEGNPVKLDPEKLKIFCGHVANSVNENFNVSEPSLKAETKELRIQAEHASVSGDNTIALSIRKTPCISRLGNVDLVKTGYANEIVNELLPCLMRARLSGITCGDVGSGKTELCKHLCKFIPPLDGIITVEDTLELRLKDLYPAKDIYSMRITDTFTAENAIRDALRLMTKWLIIAEARGREIKQIMEGASTGCTALTTIHAENTWEIPDRIMNMVGDDAHTGFENDVYSFFDFAIRVKADISTSGIKRKIDQISFFDRTNGKNSIVVFLKDGKLTGERLPARIEKKFNENEEVSFLNKYIAELKQMKSLR